jgi:diphthamide synthase subunit DPH2
MKFNIKDIDHEFLKKRAYEEARLIFLKESTRRNRTLEDIAAATMYGHAPEVYLIQHQGYKDDVRPYKDVFDTSGKEVEIKVTEIEEYVPYVLERCNTASAEKFRKYAKKLYIFIGNKKTLDYHLYGMYSYNGTKFIKDMV